ncbi:MAG TPA: GNAT family N-acetyltransferase [Brumimicrobium sp.]|nr:GNAT family N-acetyltransferase [Brumimicrobium sp.]
MNSQFENIELINNEDKKRFELHHDGHFAFITYEVKEGVWYLEHTVAPEELRGTGVAKAMALKVFTLLKERNVKIQPICSYLHGFIQRNGEWKNLVDKKYEKYSEL